MIELLQQDALGDLDNVIDGALALPEMAAYWRVPGDLDGKRMALIQMYLQAADPDGIEMTEVAARAIDRLENAFAACKCHDGEEKEK